MSNQKLLAHHADVCPLFQIYEDLRVELLTENVTVDIWQFRHPQSITVFLQDLRQSALHQLHTVQPRLHGGIPHDWLLKLYVLLCFFCVGLFLSVCICLKSSLTLTCKKKNHPLHSTTKSLSQACVGNTRGFCVPQIVWVAWLFQEASLKNVQRKEANEWLEQNSLRQVVVIMQCKTFQPRWYRKPPVTVMGQDYDEANRLVISDKEVICVTAACLSVSRFIQEPLNQVFLEPGGEEQIQIKGQIQDFSVWDRVNSFSFSHTNT